MWYHVPLNPEKHVTPRKLNHHRLDCVYYFFDPIKIVIPFQSIIIIDHVLSTYSCVLYVS